MALGFLARRSSPTMPRKTTTLLIVRYTSVLSSTRVTPFSPPLSDLLLRGSSQRLGFVGGIKIPTLVRHLIGTAERADVEPDAERAECSSPGSYSSDPWGMPRHVHNPDRFYGDGLGRSRQNRHAFFGGSAEEGFRSHRDPSLLYGGSGRLELNADEYRVGTSSGQSFDGRRNPEYEHGGQRFDGPQNPQQNLSSFSGGNLGEAHKVYPTSSLQEKCSGVRLNPSGNVGSSQLDQGIVRPLQGEVHQDTNGNNDAEPTDQSVETGGSNCYKGTLDELDNFLAEGKVKAAVQVLDLLEKKGMVLDIPRFLKLLEACGDAKAVDEARVVHDYILRTMDSVGVKVYNRILDMYCRCGSIQDAYQWFDRMPERNFTSWDTIMIGLADNGLGEDAINLFNSFLQMGLRPDSHMFISLFHVCSILGAVDEGMLHFESMSMVFGISPSMEHYVSIVNMLGETGYLDEAMEFIERMPTEPSVDVWEALMNRCRLQGNLELGNRCAEIVDKLDPTRLTDHSKGGLLPVKALDLAKEKQKKANLLEVRSRVHEYRAGDTSHPENDRIYGLIRGLAATLRESGYVPDTRFVLHDIEQESKEEALLAHSERLATAYGLISSSAGSPIRIIKNLRICGDCHSYMKIVSKLVGRELIIRDAKRFHHFKDGICSCRDYW